MSTELTIPQNQLSVPQSTGALIAAVIQAGVTTANVEVIERLVALKEREDTKNAERDFNAAFVALQTDMPVIVATSEIKNRGKYERFEDVMRVVGPLLQKHGFAVCFHQKADDTRITVTCRLAHISGHSQENSFSVRFAGRADSDVQQDCKVSTTAKRNALLQALNIVIRQDIFQSDEADATMEGDGSFITEAEAADFQTRVEGIGANVKAFLDFANAPTFSKILAADYHRVNVALIRKEKDAR